MEKKKRKSLPAHTARRCCSHRPLCWPRAVVRAPAQDTPPYLERVEHSMCQPGLPFPQGDAQNTSCGLAAFHRAKSLACRLSVAAANSNDGQGRESTTGKAPWPGPDIPKTGLLRARDLLLLLPPGRPEGPPTPLSKTRPRGRSRRGEAGFSAQKGGASPSNPMLPPGKRGAERSAFRGSSG